MHGSRAAGTAKAGSDIDIAIRVSPERFDDLLKEVFTRVKPGNAAERTMQRAVQTGKIQRGELRLSKLGESLENQFGFTKVDISVIREGGPFDQGVWTRLP